jgi:PAS domain S-box-containing protein
MISESTKPGIEAALRLVVAGTAAETGSEFFRGLVRNLAQALGTLGAWVTEYLPEQQCLRALAMWLEGGFVEHFEYPIAGTACADVVESRKLVHIPDRLLDLFPREDDLVPRSAVSYLGAPLLDADGNAMGHLSVLDDKPMPGDARAISLFEIFSARAAAEYRRLKAEQAARGREEQMTLLLETALDATMVLDGRLDIVRVNPAAERLLGCTAEDLLGESLKDVLAPESLGRVEAFAKEIQNRPQTSVERVSVLTITSVGAHY